METTQVNRKQIDDLRAWFFAKDRSISLAQDTLYYLFAGGVANGAYMSMAFINETVLSASATSVVFSNIPQDFRHLMLFSWARTDRVAELDSAAIRFNGDTGNNYDFQQVNGSSTTAAATVSRGTNTMQVFIAEATNSRAFNFSLGIGFIPNYSINTVEKRIIAITDVMGNLSADTDLQVALRTGHWRNTNVLTSITVLPQVGTNLVSGSRFQFYGIL